jgi:hypothetical protein
VHGDEPGKLKTKRHHPPKLEKLGRSGPREVTLRTLFGRMPSPASDRTLTLRFDGSQNHRIDAEWFFRQARNLGSTTEDYAHLGALMLELVGAKTLGPVGENALPVTFTGNDTGETLDREHMRLIAGTLRIDLFAAESTTRALLELECQHIAEMIEAENPGPQRPYTGPPALDPGDPSLTPIDPDEHLF